MKIQAGHEEPVLGQPRGGTGDQPELVAEYNRLNRQRVLFLFLDEALTIFEITVTGRRSK